MNVFFVCLIHSPAVACFFRTRQSDGQYKVWRHVEKELDPKNIIRTVKYVGGSILVWRCMSAGEVGELVFIDDIMDKMQDNDAKHTEKSVKLYLLYHCMKELHTPPQSSDLNVIQNVWSRLEKSVYEHATSKEDLKNVLSTKKRRITTQMSMSYPGFEPTPYGTAVSVTSHYTGWARENFKPQLHLFSDTSITTRLQCGQ
ncbi:transposable element Tc1 transposase [Trichonephila clavipes]|nr:transposable element Tc1 transposase [Trichonephila clavipes]